jgi:hypothetical protein
MGGCAAMPTRFDKTVHGQIIAIRGPSAGPAPDIVAIHEKFVLALLWGAKFPKEGR